MLKFLVLATGAENKGIVLLWLKWDNGSEKNSQFFSKAFRHNLRRFEDLLQARRDHESFTNTSKGVSNKHATKVSNVNQSLFQSINRNNSLFWKSLSFFQSALVFLVYCLPSQMIWRSISPCSRRREEQPPHALLRRWIPQLPSHHHRSGLQNQNPHNWESPGEVADLGHRRPRAVPDNHGDVSVIVTPWFDEWTLLLLQFSQLA